MILYNLGEAEVSAGELRSRGMYQGSNVSYNLKKLVAMGYVHHERCDMDRRSVRVRLTAEGQAVRDLGSACSSATPKGWPCRACWRIRRWIR